MTLRWGAVFTLLQLPRRPCCPKQHQVAEMPSCKWERAFADLMPARPGGEHVALGGL